MAAFERVNFLRASLSPGEGHLYSFKGFLCDWVRGRFSSKETPRPIEGAALLGHVTTARLILEPRRVDGLSIAFQAIDPEYLARIAPDVAFSGGLSDAQTREKETNHLTDQIGYLSFDLTDIDHLGVFGSSACWPVMKYNMNGRDPAFLPHMVFRVNHYTGPIIGPPALDEFAEIIKDQGVSIVTYASEESHP